MILHTYRAPALLAAAILLTVFGSAGAPWLVRFASAQPLIIQRVTVVDATGKAAQPGMTVVIDGSRIASVGPWKTAKFPKNAQVVDGHGKFLIPGLWDMHVHNTANVQTYPLYIANGVVGVRDMNGPQDANAWRRQHASLR